MTLYEQTQKNWQCGKLTVLQDKRDKLFFILSTPDKNGYLRGSGFHKSIDEAIKYIGNGGGFDKEEFNLLNFKIVKTIDFSELGGEGYKEGEKVRILPDAKEKCEKNGFEWNGFEWYEQKEKMTEDGFGLIDSRNCDGWCIYNKEKKYTCYFPPSAIEPFYEDDAKVETIKIGDAEYIKSEFEEAVKDLKKINK